MKIENQENMYTANKKPVKSIICSLFVVVAFLAMQVVVSGVGVVVLSVMCVIQAGGDAVAGTQLCMEILESTGFMTNLLAITTLVSALAAILWYKLVFVKKYTKEQKQEFKEKALNVKSIMTFVLLAIACYCIAVFIAALVSVIIPGSLEDYSEMMDMALGGSAVISFITVVVLAPISEEIAFRGIIFKMLQKNLPLTVAIIIQAVLFGVYHMNIMQGIYVLPLALVLGYTAYKTKSVLPCILIHMVNNFMPTLLSLLPESAPVEIILIFVLLLCCMGIALFNRRKQEV